MKHYSMKQRKLFVILNRAVAKARRDNDPVTAEKIVQRLWKAFGILQASDYCAEEKKDYHPVWGNCGCEDWHYRFSEKRKYTGACKHQIGVVLKGRVDALSFVQESFL